MIADQKTNVVLVADTLEREFPAVYSDLRDILGRHGIPIRMISGTRSIWCRDYMPIQVAEARFVQFRYAPDYLTGKYRHLRADGQIGPGLPHVKDCEMSDIVLDGGNVVGRKGKAIVCDKVFRENPAWKPSHLLSKLEDLLEVNLVIAIPTEPGDVVGHSDGVVRFVDGDVVLVNDYRDVDAGYGTLLRRVLRRGGLEVMEVPYCPRSGLARDIPSAFGCYLNYLQVGRTILLPSYGLAEDQEVLERVRGGFPHSDVLPLDCSSLSADGGVLNCVTWTIRDPEGNPGRSAARV